MNSNKLACDEYDLGYRDGCIDTENGLKPIIEELKALLEEFTKRAYRDNKYYSDTGHLMICSKGCGPPEKCHICGSTIRGIKLLEKLEKDEKYG